MPAIDGVVSGLDTTSLINGIIGVAAIPKRTMEDSLAAFEQKREAVAGLSNRLDDLASAIDALDEVSEFQAFTTSATNDDQFSVEATSGAVAGLYDVQVHSLAASETETSNGHATAFDDVGQGTVSVTVGGVQTDVTIDGTNDTLTGLAEAIDAVDGVTAYVLDTGEATDPFRLIVQGENTGAANTIELDLSGLSGGTAPTFTETSTAADAHVTINNIDVYSADNSVDNIPGLSFDLKAVGTSPVQVNVSRDDQGLEDLVNTFVDAYNEVQSYYGSKTVFDDTLGLKGPLVGDSTARRVMDSLASMVSATYGVDGSLEALSQIGVKTKQDGTLELDSELFQSVLDGELQGTVEADFGDLRALFTDENGPLHTIRTTIEDVFTDPDSGTLKSRQDSIEGTIEDTEKRIEAFEARLTKQEERLRKQFTAMEVALGEMQSTQAFLGALLPSTGVIPGV